MKNIETIVSNNLCTSCGICTAICPKNAIGFCKKPIHGSYVPLVKPACVHCGLCLSTCPGKSGSLDSAKGASLQAKMEGESLLSVSAWSTDANIFSSAVSGGVVTQLVKDLLEMQAYDCAFLVGDVAPGQQPSTEKITRTQSLKATQKSKYVQVSHAATLKHMIGNPKERTIIVAVPCAIRGLIMAIEALGLQRDNYLFIGLFCDKTMTQNTLSYFEKFMHNDKIVGIDFRSKEVSGWPGDVRIRGARKNVTLPRRYRMEVKEYFQPEACLYCLDKLNIHADISVGDNYTGDGANSAGSCSVVIRTPQGMSAWSRAEKDISVKKSSMGEIAKSQHLDKRAKNYAFGLLKEKQLESENPSSINEHSLFDVDPEQYSAEYEERLQKIKIGADWTSNPKLLEDALAKENTPLKQMRRQAERARLLFNRARR